jgi:hypothetical protein
MRFEYGFGFDELYHPYVEALKAGSVAGAARLLSDFYQVMECYITEMPTRWDRWPVQAWGDDPVRIRDTVVQTLIPPGQFTYFSRGYFESAQVRATRLFALLDSIERSGFDWKRTFWGSNLAGVRVGDAVLVQGGQHRVAVLGFLGSKYFPISIRSRRSLVPSRLVPQFLPLVVSGVISQDTATRILSRISDGLRADSARSYGFPFADSSGN